MGTVGTSALIRARRSGDQLRGMHQHRIDRRKSPQKIKAILSRVGRQYVVLHRLHHELARREPFRLLFLDHQYHQRSHDALPYRVPPMRAPLRVSGWFRFADKRSSLRGERQVNCSGYDIFAQERPNIDQGNLLSTLFRIGMH
jgi:hypothetical protein